MTAEDRLLAALQERKAASVKVLAAAIGFHEKATRVLLNRLESWGRASYDERQKVWRAEWEQR